MSSNLQIGQLIYIVSNETQTVLPGLIQEEINVRNLQGEIVSYKVLVGNPRNPKSKIIDLTKVKGEVYADLEEVKQALLQKFTEFVDGVCHKAQQYSVEWYGEIGNQNMQNLGGNEKIDPASIMNEVSNNDQQYMQIPNNQHQMVAPANFQQARRQLQNNMTDVNQNPVQLVQMPDGSFKEVAININNPKQ